MPAPKSAAPDVSYTEPGRAGTSNRGLPADFFDGCAPTSSSKGGGAASSSKSGAAALPADFFDARAAAARPEADAGPSVGPALPPGMRRRPPPGREDTSDLPAPSDPAFFSKVPAPKASVNPRTGKRRVLLKAQIDLAALRGDSSDDEAGGAAAKRARAAAGGAGKAGGAKHEILGFLPAPKREQGPRKGGGGGGGLEAAVEAREQRERERAAGAAAAAAAAVAPAGNEVFRVAPAPAAGDEYRAQAAPAGYYAAQPAADYRPYHDPQQQQQQQQRYAAPAPMAPPSRAATPAAASFAGMSMEEAALQMALQEEADRAARRGAGGASSMSASIMFEEVDAARLKYVDPARKEANDGIRAALGSGYAAQLHAQAAPFAGDKMARRKHQIGTLFHNAKMKELEILENRASAMKSKAETQGKYGF